MYYTIILHSVTNAELYTTVEVVGLYKEGCKAQRKLTQLQDKIDKAFNKESNIIEKYWIECSKVK